MSKLRKKKINIFMKWGLKIKGWSDAKNEIPDKSDVEGFEKYYYTPFIGEQISKFISIAEDEFSKIRDKLTKLNESIENLNDECKARFDKACQEIKAILKEIDNHKRQPNTPQIRIIIESLEAEITKKEQEAGNEIQEINSKGNKNEKNANELLENYKYSFNEGLTNCVEKIEIYWGSVYLKNKKMNTGININARLPTKEELLKMCSRENPSNHHSVNHYNGINLDEIDKIKFNN